MARGIETKCLHLEEEEGCSSNYGAVSYPIYQTATYAHLGVGKSTGYDYSRLQNPTREHLEKVVATLENGSDALAFSTGMAAIALLMELFSPGDHLIVDADLYGGSIRLFHNVSEKNGITFSRIDCCREDVESYVNENTKAIYIETPTNPMMNVTDIEALGGIAKRHHLLLIVDNTFLSPYFQNPLDLGADIVVHSGTKYLGGHNDTLAGFLVTNREDISEQFRFLSKTTGAGLAPFDSWLILRGIKTLGIRMEKSQQNALAIANWLQGQNAVTKVIYPGLPTHPGYEIMKKQARGFGAMLTFQLESKEFALAILEKVRMIKFAESLGGVETLITYPTTQTHADVPEEIRERNGITDSTLRLSVGIEDVKDLLEELDKVFREIERRCSMSNTYQDLQNSHPCFGGHKNNVGRIHLPVSPGCNIACRFCDRVINDVEERPGVTSKVITPEESINVLEKALSICPEITVAGIAGPGDTLATDYALETFRKVKEKFPKLIKCMSTNGLLLYEKADEVIDIGIDSLTVTVNAVKPEILAKLNKFIIYHSKKYEGIEGAEILIENQLKGIKKVAAAGLTIKINTVLVPEINGGHIEEIAKTVKEAGASIYNIIPLIPQYELADRKAPDCLQIDEARTKASKYIDVFRHCQHCRADAVGVPGKSEYGDQIYQRRLNGKETFSHG